LPEKPDIATPKDFFYITAPVLMSTHFAGRMADQQEISEGSQLFPPLLNGSIALLSTSIKNR
jgi:hypothetical protein